MMLALISLNNSIDYALNDDDGDDYDNDLVNLLLRPN
jgi:hypothetical protein